MVYLPCKAAINGMVRNMIMVMMVRYMMIMMMMVRYMRKDGTLRFGDFVAIILNLTVAFCKFVFYLVKNKYNYKYQSFYK